MYVIVSVVVVVIIAMVFGVINMYSTFLDMLVTELRTGGKAEGVLLLHYSRKELGWSGLLPDSGICWLVGEQELLSKNITEN